jgi:hypothetical protein
MWIQFVSSCVVNEKIPNSENGHNLRREEVDVCMCRRVITLYN